VIVLATAILGIVGLLLLLEAPTSNAEYESMAQCLSKERQFGVAIAMFAQEHNGSLPEKIGDLSQ
jgi:hypothetical protein